MESASQPAAQQPDAKPAAPRVGVRVLLFVLIELLTLMLLGPLLSWAGLLIQGAVTTFVAAALANAVTLRIFERGRPADIGLELTAGGGKNFLLGFGGGAAAGLFVIAVPLLAGWASMVPAPEQPRNWLSLLFVTVVLLFGAFGEEMLFRGYGFQILLRRWGPFSTILPTSVLFAWAHSNNPDVTPLALANTFLWGALFGFCFLRSGDLWLPIGLHFGWNWILPLLGMNLSGFTMSVTGYKMTWTAGQLWSGGGYGPEGSLLTLLVLPAVGYYLWRAPVVVSRPFLLDDLEV